MWVCRKCQQQATGENRICRACGGILEEVPDGQLVAEGIPTGEPEKGLMYSATEAPAHPEAAAPWKCPKCGEMVPGTFEVCWQCLSDKAGQQPANAQQLLSELDGDGQDAGALDEVTETPGTSEIRSPETDDEAPKPGTAAKGDDEELASKCPRCGSTRTIPDVMVQGNCEPSDWKLKVVVYGDPEALIFKDRLYGEVKADICGKCGHMELRVVNPGELYEHYQKSRGVDYHFDARTFTPVSCRGCGMMMSGKVATCPHCGASQMD